MRDYKLYLKDILSAIKAIEKFVKGMEIEEFRRDDKTASAVIRKFEIIGEAAKKIPEDVKQSYPLIPWKEMAGMRDKLIHFYFGIDYNLVWQVIKHRIPQIKSLLSKKS
ncbi:MAG: DUF86 domain-containing protein [Candidatus Omnitrophota bacterium]